MNVDGGNTNSHTLTGLINGQTYTMSIVGTSFVLPSAPVSAGTVDLGIKKNNAKHVFRYMSSALSRPSVDGLYIDGMGRILREQDIECFQTR